MLNTASVSAVGGARFSQHFHRPCYDSYCFSNFPATIQFLLTGEGKSTLPVDVFGGLATHYDKVIFIFVDGFGWKFFERYAERFELLKLSLQQGVVSKLTSQFPSTTAAHVTCIHTGLDVGQSGVYEWQYYEPLVDDVISPLLFSYAGDKANRDTLKRTSVPPAAFFPRQTFYDTLSQHGVRSHILQYHAYTASTYSDIVFRGATVHPYHSLQEPCYWLADIVNARSNHPVYGFFYFDRIDAKCHLHGPKSRQSEEAISNFWETLEHCFYRNVRDKSNKGSKTLLMISADHGQTEVDPYTTFYLNHQIPGIERYFKTNAKGHPIVPAGSPRDMFLHVKEELIDELIALLRLRLAGKSEIYRTEELLTQGFFGAQKPSQTFLNRVGNLVVLPYARETVWWYEEGRFDMHFRGHHGGLTAEEMEIPLLLLSL